MAELSGTAVQPLAGQPTTKIVAVHVSYRSRAMERGTLPPWPSYFLKPPNTLAASEMLVAKASVLSLRSGLQQASEAIGVFDRSNGFVKPRWHVRFGVVMNLPDGPNENGLTVFW